MTGRLFSLLIFLKFLELKGVSTCPSIPEVQHATSESFYDGGVVKFKCDEGFIMDGDATLICSNDAWLTSPPSCKPRPVTAGDPCPPPSGSPIPPTCDIEFVNLITDQNYYCKNNTQCPFGNCFEDYCTLYTNPEDARLARVKCTSSDNCREGAFQCDVQQNRCQLHQPIKMVTAIHGGWSSYGPCSRTCKKNAIQTRTCTNPEPKYGGNSCSGSSSRSCNQNIDCPIHGGWSSYGPCSRTCKKNAIQTRTCTNPEPKYGGNSCSGSSSRSCNQNINCESVIFITGGYGGYDSTEVLDPQDSGSPCSRLTGSLPDGRYGHSMSRLDDGELVLCGGAYGTLTSCISTSSPAGPWETHSQLTASRYDHASAVTGDTIHVLAGWSPSGATRTAESLVDGRWKERRELPYSISGAACAVSVNNSAVFVSGGYDAMTKSAMWNPTTDQWTPLADMEQPGRRYHGCTVVTRGGKLVVLVAGGWDDDRNYLSTSRLYDVEGNYWTAAGELNQARDEGVMVNTGKGIYYIGGRNGNGGLDSVEQFNIETNKWVTKNIKMKVSRNGFAAVAVDRSTFC